MKRILPIAFLLLTLALLLVACGGAADNAPVAEAVDPASLPVTVQAADVNALLDNPDVVLIDVREPDEYAAGHIPGATLIPLGSIPSRMSEIPADKTVIAVCRSGNRSGQATQFLRDQGFDNVHNMDGGMIAWEQAGYQVEK
ncbi:MAG: rhodanese-like domain-containing protein [Caldilineales bacterium]|nr:rhodanese-like domain-containing protein [Caldilineales bacterium]